MWGTTCEWPHGDRALVHFPLMARGKRREPKNVDGCLGFGVDRGEGGGKIDSRLGPPRAAGGGFDHVLQHKKQRQKETEE